MRGADLTLLVVAAGSVLLGWLLRGLRGASLTEPILRASGDLRDVVEAAMREVKLETANGLAEVGGGLRQALAEHRADQRGEFEVLAGALTTVAKSTSDNVARLTDNTSAGASRAREELTASLLAGRQETAQILQNQREELVRTLETLGSRQKEQLDSVAGEISALTERTGFRLDAVRDVVDRGLKDVSAEAAAHLDQIRETVGEKLEGTLERRLGESFQRVSERLELVQRGLGEMQALSTGVTDLRRVLTNVKARGTWGEVQLGALLEDLLAPGQYTRNVKTNPGSNDVVEYAIRLPGSQESDTVWLPIDAKFPVEDYQRLLIAQENGDPVAVEAANKALDARLRASAKDLSTKHVNPPTTTDFAIMFLPTEGLYAEAIRRPGLMDSLQREVHVVVAGPTTLGVILNSLRLGFRTLAIQKRSSEVWTLLSSVKNEFRKFGDILDGIRRKLEQASTGVDDAAKRSRAIERHLRTVEESPSTREINSCEGNEPDEPQADSTAGG